MLATKLKDINPEIDPLHDFRNYLYFTFTEVLDLPAPDPMQYDIAYWMQHAPPSSDGIVRQQIQAMRGCGKSVIAAVFCTWLWYCNPKIRIVVLSSIGPKANELAGLVKDILDLSPLLEHLRPHYEDGVTMRRGKKIHSLSRPKNTEQFFDVRGCGPGKDPSFAAYPVHGGWTGSHPDIIIPDDTEIPENSRTVLWRTRLYDKLQECESLVMEGGKIMYMGTPQTEESIYNKLDDAGYKIRRWPAELPDPNDEIRSKNVAPWLLERVHNGEKVGSPSYPERFPVMRLLEKKAKGLAYYNLQMLLDTTLADQERYPLKLKNLIVLDTPADMAPTNVVWGTAARITHFEYSGFTGDYLHTPAFVEEAWGEYQDKVLYIDPKGGGADSVGYAVGGILNGIIYAIDVGGFAAGQDGTSDVIMRKLALLAATYGIKRVIVESNWGGSKDVSTYAKLLQPFMAKHNGPTQIETNYVQGQKERRILDCLEPIVNTHRLVFSEKTARCIALTYQFTHLTRESGALSHDDEIDALYGMVSRFTHLVVLDPEQREADRRKVEAEQLAREWDQWTQKHGQSYVKDQKTCPKKQRQKERAAQRARRVKASRWSKA